MKNVLLSLIISLALFIVIVNAKADETEEYVIKKGDTLWSISDTKLEDYFLWPKLWSVNPQIDNPDLIYPGTRIIIPTREELMRMTTIPMEKAPSSKKAKLKSKPSYDIPEKAIERYVIDKDLFIASGWIADNFPSIGEVLYSPGDRKILGPGDTAYLKFYTETQSNTSKTTALVVKSKSDEKIHDKYFVIKNVKQVRHPVSGVNIGQQIRIAGIIEITGMDDNTPKALVTSSFEEINIGDGLLPYSELIPPLYSDNVRTPDIHGFIIESHSNSVMSSKGSIVFLDKGKIDGLQEGDVFTVYSELPVERSAGKIQVIALQEKTSTAVILESSAEIFLASKWGPEK